MQSSNKTEATMFLSEPPESTETKALYSRGLAGEGYVMNLTRLWAWRPDVFEAFLADFGRRPAARK